MNLWQTPTFKHRHQIKQLIKPWQKLQDFGGTAICMVIKSGKSAWLSSTPKITMHNVHAGLHRGDLLLNYTFVKRNRVIFPEEFTIQDELQRSIDRNLAMYHLYRGYCFTRFCDDCCVLVSYNTNQRINDTLALYRHTIDRVEQLTCDFFTATLPMYIEQLPELAQTRFATDARYRQRIITTRTTVSAPLKLSDAELAILYWSAQGKTAAEVGMIIGLTKNTVDTYRRGLIEKLQVNNMTQAVHVASSLGLIV